MRPLQASGKPLLMVNTFPKPYPTSRSYPTLHPHPATGSGLLLSHPTPATTASGKSPLGGTSNTTTMPSVVGEDASVTAQNVIGTSPASQGVKLPTHDDSSHNAQQESSQATGQSALAGVKVEGQTQGSNISSSIQQTKRQPQFV